MHFHTFLKTSVFKSPVGFNTKIDTMQCDFFFTFTCTLESHIVKVLLDEICPKRAWRLKKLLSNNNLKYREE